MDKARPQLGLAAPPNSLGKERRRTTPNLSPKTLALGPGPQHQASGEQGGLEVQGT